MIALEAMNQDPWGFAETTFDALESLRDLLEIHSRPPCVEQRRDYMQPRSTGKITEELDVPPHPAVTIRAMLRVVAPLALLLTACSVTVPPAPPHQNVRPAPATTPVQACWLEYARDEQPASYALAGGSKRESWQVTFSGLLVRHPRGDLLVDVGNSSHFAEEIATANFVPRQLLRALQGGGRVVQTAPQALAAIGEPPSSLRAIVVSHVHGDHAGGLVDLPGVPVLMPQEEIDFAARLAEAGSFHVVRAHAKAIEGRATAMHFEARPYENFDRCLDYFGDGSVVFVPLPGHTPGSVGTFVQLAGGAHVFHVGDATNSTEAIEEHRGKSLLLEGTDHDGRRADATVATIAQLHAQDPAVRILPAHDRIAWRGIFGAPGRCVGAAPRRER
jgi:N-acyl homoserine lactone hydrolase